MSRESKYTFVKGRLVKLLGTEIRKRGPEVVQCTGLSGGCEPCQRIDERRRMISARRGRHA